MWLCAVHAFEGRPTKYIGPRSVAVRGGPAELRVASFEMGGSFTYRDSSIPLRPSKPSTPPGTCRPGRLSTPWGLTSNGQEQVPCERATSRTPDTSASSWMRACRRGPPRLLRWTRSRRPSSGPQTPAFVWLSEHPRKRERPRGCSSRVHCTRWCSNAPHDLEVKRAIDCPEASDTTDRAAIASPTPRSQPDLFPTPLLGRANQAPGNQPVPGLSLIGETGFEPATARPPARGVGSR